MNILEFVAKWGITGASELTLALLESGNPQLATALAELHNDLAKMLMTEVAKVAVKDGTVAMN